MSENQQIRPQNSRPVGRKTKLSQPVDDRGQCDQIHDQRDDGEDKKDPFTETLPDLWDAAGRLQVYRFFTEGKRTWENKSLSEPENNFVFWKVYTIFNPHKIFSGIAHLSNGRSYVLINK